MPYQAQQGSVVTAVCCCVGRHNGESGSHC